MQDDDQTDTANRRSVLKTVTAGAFASTFLGGAASAEHLATDDGGIGAKECVREWTEYQCVDSGCDCDDPCTDCSCETKQQSRDCCEDSIGHTFCGSWTDTGNCCTSC